MSKTITNQKLVLPSKEQVKWLKSEIGVIIHFDLQVFEPTYNWREKWGYTPDAKVFNPPELDTDQWLETAKKAGAKYAILVAKHCSGFSLWPTKAHDYSVASSPWRDGKGDLVAEFIASCKKYDIKPGLYCSASANAYMKVENPGKVLGGTEEDNRKYNEMVVLQLTELWGNYGKLFEVWFDGGVIPEEAGGPPIAELHTKLQPQALALGAPVKCNNRVRHAGAEDGTAILPAWGTANSAKPTHPGDPDGDAFMPIEAIIANRDNQTSFQGGWFWKDGQDSAVHSVSVLLDRYYKSVGRNSNLILGMVIDDRGLVPDVDKKTFEEFGDVVNRLNDIPRDTTSGEGYCFELDITNGDYISEVLLMEKFSEGERIRKYLIQAFVKNEWETVAKGQCIGHKRLIEFPKVKTDKIRLKILESIGTPHIEEFSVYFRIPLPQPPQLDRDDNGIISIEVPKECEVHYTVDGSIPTKNSKLYSAPFCIPEPGVIRAVSTSRAGSDPSFPELNTNLIRDLYFGKLSCDWEVVYADGEYDEHNLKENILLNNGSPWISSKGDNYPHEIIVDMKKEEDINGFIYTPFWYPGHILQYDFMVGDCVDNVNTLVSSGSFADIANMPVQQIVRFDNTVKARFFKFIAKASATDHSFASIGKMEII